MNLPNKLTLLRVFMVPVFLFFLLCQAIPHGLLLAAAVFLAASFTDFLDGYISRKYNMVTDFGKLMDPLADKLLVNAALVALVELRYVPALAVIIIISREFIVTSIRLVAAGGGRVIAADRWGKYKTVSQMVWIIYLLLFHWAISMGIMSPTRLGGIFDIVLMGITVFLTVISGVNYILNNRDIFLQSN